VAIAVLSCASNVFALLFFPMNVYLATLSCALIGFNMIPIMSHGYTVATILAEDLQVSASTMIGMMIMCGSVLSPVVSIIATEIIKSTPKGAFYFYLGMTITATAVCFFIKIPKINISLIQAH